MPEPVVFRRGLFDTFLGLLHILAGFFSSLWSFISILIIGYNEVFRLGAFWGIYNYLSESTSLLLWLSGVGILRSRRWGKTLGVAWSILVIIRSVFSYYYSEYRWGAHIPEYDWDSVVKFFYAWFFLTLRGGVYLSRRYLQKDAVGGFISRLLSGEYLSGISPLTGRRK